MRVDSEQGIKLTGIYKGVVLKHLPNGKLKVFIPGIYPKEWNDFDKCSKLPDCIIAPPIFAGNNKGNGTFSYPNTDAIVLVFFDNGDQNYPIAFATLQGGDLAQEQYKEAKVVTGIDSIEKEGDDARVHKIITDKASIKMWESGKIQLKVYADRKYNTEDNPEDGCQIDISEAGTVNIKSTSQIHLESPQIKLDCSEFDLHSGTIKIQASNATQIDQNTLRVQAETQLSVYTPNEIHENPSSFYLKSPNINIDGTSGHVTVRGAPNHSPIFM